MKRSWILWNALKEPEQIVSDERTEQMEAKEYRWSYKGLEFVLWLLLLLTGVIGDAEVAAVVLRATGILLGAMVLLSLGRFLYSCSYGIQGNADRTGGMAGFLAGCAVSGLLGVWGIRGFLWGSTWRSLTAFLLGALLYAVLCHLVYLPYAAQTEEEAEGHSDRRVFWICLAVLAVWGTAASVGTYLFYTGERPLLGTNLSAEEWDWAKRIEKGRERYLELESTKTECFYGAEGEDKTDPYQNGSMTHALYWTVPEQLYTAVLDPETGEPYKEFYRNREQEWYTEENGRWVSQREAIENGTSAEEEAVQPYTGMLELQMEAVKEIRQKEPGVYVMEYGSSYEILEEMVTGRKSENFAGITETYRLNEYGILTGYQAETYRYSEEGEKVPSEYISFELLSADVEKNQKEIREMMKKYETAL